MLWKGLYKEQGVLASTKSQEMEGKGGKRETTESHSTVQLRTQSFFSSVNLGFVLVLFQF